MFKRRQFLATGGLTGMVGMVALTGCSPATFLNAAAPNTTYECFTDIAYAPNPRQRLDVYRPSDALQRPAGGWPVALFFYGGSWRSGERGSYRFLGEALASRGVLTLIADYRLYPEVRYPDFVRDSALALAWTYRELRGYGGDRQRLYVMGHSAGGYNAAMLALDRRWLGEHGLQPAILAGWIGLAGPYNFAPIGGRMIQPIFSHPDTPPDSQPIVHVSAKSPRAFIGTAARDGLVDPQRNARQLAARLSAAQVPVTLRVYDDVDHFTLIGAFSRPMRFIAPVLDDVAEFIVDSAAITPAV